MRAIFVETKKRILKEVWIGLGLVLIAAYFRFIACNELNEKAAEYPKYMFSLLLIMSLALTIQGVYFSLKPSAINKTEAPLTLGIIKFPMLVFADVVLYLIAFYYLGFFVATSLFIPLTMFLYGEKKILKILAVTVGLDVFVYVVFYVLLHVHF